MRIPFAALLLALATVFVYLQSSGGFLYPDYSAVLDHSYGLNQFPSLVFHLFYHLGLKHFVGNVLPLLVFAILLGLVVSDLEVVGLFLASGMLSALVFSLLNPTSFLVGASSGVSALMTASALLKPRLGLAFLIAVPIFTFFIAYPFLDQAAQNQVQSLAFRQAALEKTAKDLEGQKKFSEAQAVLLQANATGMALLAQKDGKSREESAQSDFLVHLVGALLGAGFVLWRHPKELEAGLTELWPFFEAVRSFFGKSGK